MVALRDYADYPPQEPFSPIGKVYHARAQELSAGIAGEAFAYGTSPYQEVAVFTAAKPDGRVLVFMHGGGWTNGYKEWMAFMAPPLNAAGATFVSADYRLAPANLWPDGRDDAAAAMAWVYANIAGHGGDPNRIYIGGHSAGGHYAAWLAVRDDWQKTAGTPPPFLMAWGDADFPQLTKQAGQMAAALTAQGVTLTALAEMAGCDHAQASFVCADPTGPWLPVALAFMTSG